VDNRLLPLNALLALLSGEGGWPSELGNAGYLPQAFEVPIILGKGSGAVRLDGVAAHEATQSAVIAECKSGKGVDPRQAEGYQLVTPEHLARQVGFPFRIQRVDRLYVCVDENADSIRRGLGKAGYQWPVLAIGQREVVLDTPLSGVAAFTVGVTSPPPRLVVLDDHSSPAELVECLLPGVVQAASKRQMVVGVEELLRPNVAFWELYSPQAQAELCTKATDALRALFEKHYPKAFGIEHRVGVRCGIVRIHSSPAGFDPRGATQGWQALSRQGARALGRAPRRQPPPGQMSLEDLGLSTEMRET